MCGIAGFITATPGNIEELEARVGRMTGQLVHRGPDDSGAWVDVEVGLALGSRRLAIVDLSPAGHQPMLSSCERYVIVFNGEVYNFQELRRELIPRGHKFRGHSDTEVMLEAIREWGLEAAIREFVGMFAFALWDRQERTLHLVRDRLGIKPLYYGFFGKTFLFGSELKALRVHPDFAAEINRDALALQLEFNYVPVPHSIYKDANKLSPGSILTIQAKGSGLGTPRISAYWSAREVYERGAADPFRGPEEEAADQLETLLRQAVRLRMIADVPLGAFLSGGIDSSTVVALMRAESARPVKTFTIGFHDEKYNEADQARAVAARLGTEHSELYVTPEDTRAVIPKLPVLFDEPFSDSSSIPTYLVSALARRHVTVSLSGDGGDELFGGYDWYTNVRSAWAAFGWLPHPGRRVLARLLAAWEPETYNRWLGWLSPLADHYGRPASLGEKMHKLAEALPVESADALQRHLTTHWKHATDVVLGAGEGPTAVANRERRQALPGLLERMMFLDLTTYLPDDILTKVDRASMGVSLEARVPLLDHRVVEFAARLPASLKIRSGRGKWLLRRVLWRHVPQELVERRKMGFSVPLDDWLRRPLRAWAEELLSEGRLEREGYFRPEPVRRLWAEHLSGRRNRAEYLWDVLTFQAWREKWA